MKDVAAYPELGAYEFEEIIYLKKFLFLPSSSLYKTFEKLYKPRFNPNERIVCAFQGEIPYDLLAHLQRVVQHLDISNCFIVICNTHAKTAPTLDSVHSRYSTDLTKFEICALDIDDSHCVQDPLDHSPLLNPPETMCMYPWNAMEFKPNGTVRPCCVYSQPVVLDDGKEFNMNNNKSFLFDDIYYSESMRDLRQQFRQGKKPSGCNKCWVEESQGKKSDRLLYNWTMRNKFYDMDYEIENVENITSLDLKLGNLCNLSCRICSPELSSSWAVEDLKGVVDSTEKSKHPSYISLSESRWTETQKSFWDEFDRFLPHLTYCQFAGGEPLMIPQHFEVLKKAVVQGHAKNISLRYNTNGTQCPEFVFDLWKEFKSVNLDISIDDINERFEYQRNGANWATVVKNIQRFNQDKPHNFVTQVTTSVSIMNVLYLPEICKWYDSENFDSWWLNIVWNPKSFSIANMTPAAKDLVLNRLKNYHFGQHQSQIDMIISMIQNSKPANDLNFINKIQHIDNVRNQDFKLGHKEIASAMGFVLNC